MKKQTFISVRLIVLTALLTVAAFGNTVSLDPTFNGTGYNIQSIGAGNGYGNSVAILPNGKILLAGGTTVNQDSDKPVVMRLNADGTLDMSFAGGGFADSPVSASSSGVRMLIQPDGRILLSATSGTPQTFGDFAVIRLTSDGNADTSFNSSGFARADIDLSLDDCFNIALQPDGKILLVGRTWKFSDQQYDIAIMRFNADGSPDTTFNGTGILRLGTPGADEEAHSVFVQADGKILVGGLEKTDSNRFLLTRLNPNGTTDTNFGTGGKTVTGLNDTIGSIALQSDGKIIAGGKSGHIARYTTGGVLDATFAAGGVAEAPAEINEIRVIGGDKILTAAKFGANAGVLRFMANGAPDTNFNGGSRNISMGNTCTAASIGVQADGKIVLGGYCIPSGIIKYVVFRLAETRTKRWLDFDGDGATDFSVFRPSVGEWWIQPSWNAQTSSAAQFGTATDRPVPGDYTGDGRTDIAFWRASTGEWFVLRSDNATFFSFPFGASGDVPVTGDFDGDQLDDPGVFRPSTNEWFVLKSTGGTIITTFGASSDKLVPSDYDGDFKTDIAIYRPSSGEWWIQRSSDGGVYAFRFGTASDKPVAGEYTGDNRTDAAFWRPSTGEWFVLRSEDSSYYSVPFGLSDDLPAPGNYSGDDRYDLVVFRPSTAIWHVQITGAFYFTRGFGATGDQPLPNLFVP